MFYFFFFCNFILLHYFFLAQWLRELIELEQSFLIFVSDLCYQQWHQQFNIQYHLFSFPLQFCFRRKNSSFSFLSLFLSFFLSTLLLIWWRLVTKISEFKNCKWSVIAMRSEGLSWFLISAIVMLCCCKLRFLGVWDFLLCYSDSCVSVGQWYAKFFLRFLCIWRAHIGLYPCIIDFHHGIVSCVQAGIVDVRICSNPSLCFVSVFC